MLKKVKVGIMGGTFNPIHFGHLILAESAYDYFQLNTIVFIPSGYPPHKKNNVIVSKKHRLKMAQLAIEDNNHFEISTIEIDNDGYSYTVETLNKLVTNNKNKEYYFIIGADSLFNIHKWKEPEKIFDLCKIIVASRDNLQEDILVAKKKYVEKKYKTKIHLLPMVNIDISSSNIRQRISDNKTIKYFVPKDVEAYIYMNNLYR